jgi:hypothetical protein
MVLLHTITCDHDDHGQHCNTHAWSTTVLAGYTQALRNEGWLIIPGTRGALCPHHNPNRQALATATTPRSTP